MERVLDALTRGKGLVHTVTIPEGFALAASRRYSAERCPYPRNLSSSQPVTPRFAGASTCRRQRSRATFSRYLHVRRRHVTAGGRTHVVSEFEKVWKPEWDDRLQVLAMSANDIVTTRVHHFEKEARLAEERPVISAVYHNRLKIGMLLQADPTVQYALGKHVDRVLFKDLEVDSRYNTYKHPGLPPGPMPRQVPRASRQPCSGERAVSLFRGTPGRPP